MSNQDIFTMKLHDEIIPDSNTVILRVPGGWLYMHLRGTTFVPFSREFMETPKEELRGDLARNGYSGRCARCQEVAKLHDGICGNCFDELRDEEKANRAMESL